MAYIGASSATASHHGYIGAVPPGSIANNNIAAAAVGKASIAANVVGAGELINASIANTHFAAASVDAAAVKANAVTTGKIVASAVTSAKVADSAVTYNKLNANSAHTDRIQSFTKAQRGAISDQGVRTGPASTNTVTLDLATNNNFHLTTSGNVTDLTFSNHNVAGQTGTIKVVNSGHTIAVNAMVAIYADTLTALQTAGSYMLTYLVTATGGGSNTILISSSGALT